MSKTVDNTNGALKELKEAQESQRKTSRRGLYIMIALSVIFLFLIIMSI
jgi:hypothetical protein